MTCFFFSKWWLTSLSLFMGFCVSEHPTRMDDDWGYPCDETESSFYGNHQELIFPCWDCRQKSRGASRMDSAWNQGQQSPLKPGEVENDIDEKPNYQKKARTHRRDSVVPGSGCCPKNDIWLVVWLPSILFSHILGC